MNEEKFRQLDDKEKIKAGDEWALDNGRNIWHPCERFVGHTLNHVNRKRVTAIIVRRRVSGEPNS